MNAPAPHPPMAVATRATPAAAPTPATKEGRTMTHPASIVRTALLALAVTMFAPVAQADDGDPDPTFDTDGRAWHIWPDTFVQVETTAVAVLRDRSVVTAGWADHGNNNRDFAVAKFRSDGSLDTDFGDGGSKVIAFDLESGGDDRALGVFELADGKLLVAGSAGVGAPPYVWPATARLLANGQLDASYGSGGRKWLSTLPWSGGNVLLSAVTRTANGAIVFGGVCSSCGQGGLPDLLAVRLTATGQADAGFGSGGWRSFGRVGSDQSWMVERVEAVAVDRQGRVLLAGHEETYTDPDERQRALLLRLDAAGTPDATFGDGGLFLFDTLGSWSAQALAVDPANDSIVLALNTTNMPTVVPATMLIRVRSTGVLDTTFGDGGANIFSWAEGNAVRALAIDAQRRIAAAGWVDPDGVANAYFFAARLHHDGNFDTTFDGNGVRQLAMPIDTNTQARAYALALPGGQPVLAGSLYDGVGARFASGVARLQSDLIFADGFD
jgi:uncharacterized delta-60 repeat protein